MEATINDIMICICSYRRPEGLATCLSRIDAQHLHDLSEKQISITIIDNSAGEEARPVFDEYRISGRFEAHYVLEKEQGLSNARNAALDKVKARGASHFVFIDDDEYPEPQWIEALAARQRLNDVAAVIGPVFPVFNEQAPPAWLPIQAFTTTLPNRDGYVATGYTSNCMCATDILTRLNLAFDTQFNLTGGEDSFFFKQISDSGARIAWADQAIAYETVPASRMTRKWIWLRWYRIGHMEALRSPYAPASLIGRAYNFARGVARIFAGSLRVVGALPSLWGANPARFTASFFTLCRGLGLVNHSIGRAPNQPYSDPKTNAHA